MQGELGYLILIYLFEVELWGFFMKMEMYILSWTYAQSVKHFDQSKCVYWELQLTHVPGLLLL